MRELFWSLLQLLQSSDKIGTLPFDRNREGRVRRAARGFVVQGIAEVALQRGGLREEGVCLAVSSTRAGGREDAD